jgi:3-methylfumaryl-CoA hydratase
MAYEEYVGRTESRLDVVWPPLLGRMAATLGVTVEEVAPDGTLPPLWHWMLFQDWVTPDQIGPDGHPRRGGFLPAAEDLPRRMWAGGRLEVRHRLHAGEPVRRVSKIMSVTEKTGRSGRLVFVTVQHRIEGQHGLALIEEHDIVYRSAQGAAIQERAPAEPAPRGAFSRQILPDPVLLFRFSALTGNGHRIHYDLDYVRTEEGYPGLLVHGPLQAVLLADAARRISPQRLLCRFAFRGEMPAVHGQALIVEGWEERDRLILRTRDREGRVCTSAEAELAA